MMTKEEFIEYLGERLTYEDIEKANAEAKAYVKGFIEGLDARPEPQGEWIEHKGKTIISNGSIGFFPTEIECSNCGLKQSMYFINTKPSNYCPNCGARMVK